MIKIFLISAFIAASANAGWVPKDENNYPSGARVRRMASPTPQFPHIDLPDFSNFPARLGLPDMSNFHANLANLLSNIKVPDIKYISPEEILSHKEPGYNCVSVVTKSDGSTVVTKNIRGKTETHTYPAGSNTKTFSTVAAAWNN
ncbi:uncharacterized protein [Maniola hyperantus]|uniref:uncharacterized protein isoform X1 n=1 Tax=Aphantopus hyperantus TaxID=2795564 RepID=UPI002134F8B7